MAVFGVLSQVETDRITLDVDSEPPFWIYRADWCRTMVKLWTLNCWIYTTHGKLLYNYGKKVVKPYKGIGMNIWTKTASLAVVLKDSGILLPSITNTQATLINRR